MPADEEAVYHPKDTVKETIRVGSISTGVGFLGSAVQNALTRQNVSAWGVFTKFGGTTITFGLAGSSYTFFKLASANLRAKDDVYNTAIGGLVAGSCIGFRFGTLPAVVGYSAITAIVLGAFELTGGLEGKKKKYAEMDEFERKEKLRANKRRPIQETINELGEGRGIYPRGYQERRAARIKERYGIDVVVK